MCGVLGGTNENLDAALDVSYAVKTLLAPTLRLTGYASHQAAVAQWQIGQQAVVSAAAQGGARAARLALVAALVDAPEPDLAVRRLDPELAASARQPRP